MDFYFSLKEEERIFVINIYIIHNNPKFHMLCRTRISNLRIHFIFSIYYSFYSKNCICRHGIRACKINLTCPSI